MSTHNTLYQRKTNAVFDFRAFHDRGRDKELVLHIHKVLALLDGFEVRVLDGMFYRFGRA